MGTTKGITIVGLGPGDDSLLTREAWALLQGDRPVLLRTRQHPTVAALPAAANWPSFDDLYDSGVDFATVYAAIVERVVARGAVEAIVYAVPGHPFMAESTVPAILAAAREQGIPVRVVHGLSYLEPILTALQIDGSDGLQLLDALQVAAHLVPPLNTDAPALLAQVYNRLMASELKLTLMALYPDEHAVQLVHAAGTAAEWIEPLKLYEIDRSERISYLTSLYVPPRPSLSSLGGLADTVAVLRSPEGCPWDREQTPLSLRSGLIEEVAELLEALENDDPEHILEELGDVLLQVVMQAQMAAEGGDFTIADVIAGIDAKLKYRHPHVWGETVVADAAEVIANWEALKAAAKDSRRCGGAIAPGQCAAVPGRPRRGPEDTEAGHARGLRLACHCRRLC